MRSRRARTLAIALAALFLVSAAPMTDASHSDGAYDQPVWFLWDKAELDVLVIPPAHGQVYNGNGVLGGTDPFEATPLNSYLDATLDAIQGWRDAVQQFGSPWLKANLELNVYVLGVDIEVPTTGNTINADIIVNNSPNKGPVLGLAFIGVPGRCIIDNSRFYTQSFTYNDMYSVSGHEFGHCLGLQHINGGHPDEDILNAVYHHSPGNPSNHRHCQSNLNVATIERAFDHLHGAPSGGSGTMPISQYQTIAC